LFEYKPEEFEFGRYDVVLHLAAIVHQSEKISEIEYFRVNRDLCLRVAKASKKAGVKQFVFLSTVKVYGEDGLSDEIRNELSECYPSDPYGKSKYAAETALKELEDSDFTISIIRTPLVYGEGVKANMLNLVTLVDSFPVLPLGKIENRRNFTFAENLVGFIDRIIEKRASGIFISMDEKAQSTTELINCISEALGKKVLLFKLPQIILWFSSLLFPEKLDRLFGSLEFDNSKTRTELDYTSQVPFEEGIRRMVNYYLQNKRLKIKDKGKK
jgi:UDP-glucose 4-epimerase